jgi:glycosidase
MLEEGLFSQKDRYFPFGFPVSEKAWRRYRIDSLLPAQALHDSAQQVYAIRTLAARLNAQRNFGIPGTKPARAGELLTMDLLVDVLRYIATVYLEEDHPGIMNAGYAFTEKQAGTAVVETPPAFLIDLYPPVPVRRGEIASHQFLREGRPRLSNREVVGRELLLLDLALSNPAMRGYGELFDDPDLFRLAPTGSLLKSLEQFFETQPAVRELGLPLVRALRAPIEASPDSLEGQLAFIRQQWARILPRFLVQRLELAHGVLREENQMRGLGPGPLLVPTFGIGAGTGGEVEEYPEPEAFSVDVDWMPNVVLMAKTSHVWLDQLSKHYRRPITRLDQVPDEELDKLRRWGFTGLWLIGLWERSSVSQDIKQRMGNPEAAPSAYSLFDYSIASDLGGETAYQDLADRAWKRGIRLASDMVPNHMGLYSRWVVEHPDWFVQLDYPPYPGYVFNGPNLSPDHRVTLQIEDHYWDKTDAAVVFKWVNNHTGESRYIYHGNDGTSMPWNDTAQLNFLIPEVREAVIQTILHVARKFPIIRFDAAMTLAKKHYQRLWFPKPGDEGSVPSRTEHGMSKEAFDHVFPLEFWRDVVDRVAAEAPDTLLLAEAFWLMEGYFVRTLGMHRVYNSAFMNMLKLEENDKYRQTIKNVLEFSPEVLQRFVNFMNNPDEKTAVEQFGKGDKYFGACLMMATLPGLPMFGHGQIEGFAEKYGMEYRKAYWDEPVDEHMVWRHEREIFPILHHRYLFSGAKNFALFDFINDDGWVNENVYAYSNRVGDRRALVLFNNAFDHTWGRIHRSTAINVGSGTEPNLVHRSLAGALSLSEADNVYYIMRDHRTKLEFLHHCKDMHAQGLRIHLDGYQYYCFIEWREIVDQDMSWGRLHSALGDRGVPNMEEAYQEMVLGPILDPFRQVLAPQVLQPLLAAADEKDTAPFKGAMTLFLNAIAKKLNLEVKTEPIIAAMLDDLAAVEEYQQRVQALGLDEEVDDFLQSHLPAGEVESALPPATPIEPAVSTTPACPAELPEHDYAAEEKRFWRVPALWAVLRHMGKVAAPAPADNGHFDWTGTSAAWLHEWFLVKNIATALQSLDNDGGAAWQDARLIRLCIAYSGKLPSLQEDTWGPLLHGLFRDPDAQQFLGMHQWGGRTYLNKERFEELLHRLFLVWSITAMPHPDEAADWAGLCFADIAEWMNATADANYDVYDMLSSVQ